MPSSFSVVNELPPNIALESGGNLADIKSSLNDIAASDLTVATRSTNIDTKLVQVLINLYSMTTNLSTVVANLQTVLSNLSTLIVSSSITNSRLMPEGTQSGTLTESAGVLKTTAGSLLSFTAQPTALATDLFYLQFFDLNRIPINGDIPFRGVIFPINPGVGSLLAVGQDILGGSGVKFPTNGIAWAVSSTQTVLTLLPPSSCIVTFRVSNP